MDLVIQLKKEGNITLAMAETRMDKGNITQEIMEGIIPARNKDKQLHLALSELTRIRIQEVLANKSDLNEQSLTLDTDGIPETAILNVIIQEHMYSLGQLYHLQTKKLESVCMKMGAKLNTTCGVTEMDINLHLIQQF